MRGLFLAHIAFVRGVGVVERLAVDVLGMIRQVGPDRSRQIVIDRGRASALLPFRVATSHAGDSYI